MTTSLFFGESSIKLGRHHQLVTVTVLHPCGQVHRWSSFANGTSVSGRLNISQLVKKATCHVTNW